jgi:hypothetical protein
MFVNLIAGAATLQDIDNFKAFKVVTSLPEGAIAGALGAAGRVDGKHVWIDPAWVKAHGRPDDTAWVAGLNKMLDYAKGAGWTDEHGAVRAHIESGSD